MADQSADPKELRSYGSVCFKVPFLDAVPQPDPIYIENPQEHLDVCRGWKGHDLIERIIALEKCCYEKDDALRSYKHRLGRLQHQLEQSVVDCGNLGLELKELYSMYDELETRLKALQELANHTSTFVRRLPELKSKEILP